MDDIAAHHAAGADHGEPGIFFLGRFCHFHNGIGHAEQAVLADILRAFAFFEQGIALIFQPGEAALHPSDTGSWLDRLGTVCRKVRNFRTRREAKAQFDTHPIHSLSGIEVCAGAKGLDASDFITEQQVGGAAGNMKQQHFLAEQFVPLRSKKRGGRMALLVRRMDERDAPGQRKGRGRKQGI